MQAPTKVVGRRVAAFLIDTLITLAINAIAFFALTTQVPGKCPSGGGGYTIGDNCRGFLVGQGGKQAAFFAISLITGIVIFVILPGLRGASPGKALLGIRLVNKEGRPPGVLRAFLRYILLLVDAFPYFIPYLTGFIVALTSKRNQRVGDMAASTFVVRKDAAAIGGGDAGQLAPPLAGAQAFNAPPPQPPQQLQPPQQPADWYPDPQGQARLRYWDGQSWTEHTSA